MSRWPKDFFSLHKHKPWLELFFKFNQYNIRLRHMKNNGLRQSHTSSRNLEAIDVWKVARQPPSERVLKGILERVLPRKNTSKASQNVFYVCIAISKSLRWFKASSKRFSRMKYWFKWSNLYLIKSMTWSSTKLNMLFFVAFLN